jgi:energy-coupling factor transporter ATP-binding protein EcfA2
MIVPNVVPGGVGWRVRRSKMRNFARKRIYRKSPPFYKDNDLKNNDDDFREGIVMTELDEARGDINNEFFLAATSLNDHYITKVLNERTKEMLSTTTIKEDIVVSSKEWLDYVNSRFDGYQIVQFGESTGMIIDNDNLHFIDYTINSTSVQIRIYGDKKFVDETYKEISDKFMVAPCYLEWVYNSDGSSVNIPLLPERLPVSEMYPFLGEESIEQYYDRFMDSSASILLLIGPPGTGKTTFIRGLLHHASKNAIVTYDEKILDRDYVFARFIEDDVGIMVIEDADNFLKPRADGNTMMHRFLNVGDGLISMRGKKLIFSTNLPSIRDIDSALVRPGRCFDVVSFDNYTLEQAQKLAKKIDVQFEEKNEKTDKYSLAEVFFKQKNSSPKQKHSMGFI